MIKRREMARAPLVAWCGALLALLAVAVVSRADVCPTPVTTTTVINDASGVSLPNHGFGSDIVAAGANVMVLLADATGIHSRFSLTHGVEFPDWTDRVVGSGAPADVKLSLVSDGRNVIAVGQYQDKMQNRFFSFSDFSWRNGSTIFPDIVEHIHCAAKPSMFVCALAENGFANGVQVFHMDTSNTSAVPQWVQTDAEDMPITTTRPSVASDGDTFMICVSGEIEGTANRLGCFTSEDGKEDFVMVTEPVPAGSVSSTSPVRLASNNIKGTYIVAYLYNSEISTYITVDSGVTWEEGNKLFPGLSGALPHDIVYTDRFMSAVLSSGNVYVTFQNGSNPVQWDDEVAVTTAMEYSLGSGGFGSNYYLATKSPTNKIVVSACIPTAAPTIFTTRSPTRSSPAIAPQASAFVLLTLSLVSLVLF